VRRRIPLVTGIALLVIAAPILVFIPIMVSWGVSECGSASSSCHHFPYRPLLLIAAAVALVMGGTWLIVRGSRRT
jgi:hypothetical protein